MEKKEYPEKIKLLCFEFDPNKVIGIAHNNPDCPWGVEYLRADAVEDKKKFAERINNFIMKDIGISPEYPDWAKGLADGLTNKIFETYHLIRKEK